jgi:hypothetical protein
MNHEFQKEIYQLIRFRETVWSEDERAILKKHKHRFEGPGEQSYRQRFGITSEPSNKSIDIPEHAAELKYCDGSSFGKIGLGAYAYRKMLKAIQAVIFDKRHAEEDDYFRSLQDCLNPHENSFVTLAEYVTSEEYEGFRARLTMSHCLTPEAEQLILIMDEGFLQVPRLECDAAFTFDKCSFGKLKYKLNRSYIQNKLLSPQDIPSLLSVNIPRHEFSECSEIIIEKSFSTISSGSL